MGKFSTEMNVVAVIEERQDWNSLLFLVGRKMLKSSLLPNMSQGAVNKYLHVIAGNAQTRIQKPENAGMNAKRKIKDAEGYWMLEARRTISLKSELHMLGVRHKSTRHFYATYASRIKHCAK